MVAFAAMGDASPTAEGELARTPLAHLLVYALDRQLTGALLLTSPDGAEHVVRLARGVPVKVRPGDRYALLGEMLIEAGAIDGETLKAALATALTTQALLGDVLLLAGRVERDALEKIAEAQFVRRVVRLFALPGATGYRYFDGHDALAEFGAGPACVDPLALIWAGLRAHGDASTMLESTLARLGEGPLCLHAAATVTRFGLDADEEQLCEILKDCPLTLAELAEASSREAARRVAYALTITRQLDFGAGSLPLGADPGVDEARGAASQTAVARMALRSTVHRAGAAAPDLPGDGERGTPSVPSSRRARERAGEVGAEEPPGSSRTSTPPPSSRRSPAPISSVEPVPQRPPGHAVQAPPGEASAQSAPESGVVAIAPLTMGALSPPAEPAR
jgi:hypothetical protein